MRDYFLDTSAVVKLYALEPGSRRVRDMFRSATVDPPACRLLVCELVHPEAASALAQVVDGPERAKRGIGSLAARRLPVELDIAFQHGGPFVISEVSGIVAHAADLAWKYRMRGADAVHLAAALRARSKIDVGREFYFVGADKQQNAAAQAEGLEVIDPSV